MSTLSFDELKNVVTHFSVLYAGSVTAMTFYTPFHYAQNRRIQFLRIEGPWCWMRGWGALISGQAPALAIQLTVFGFITRFIERNSDTKATPSQNTLAAIISGGIAGPISNFTHQVALHQENTGHKFKETCQFLYNSKGGFFRGMGTTILRQMTFFGFYGAFRPFLEECVYKNVQTKNIAYFTSLSTAAIMVAITTQPFMVVTAKLYADPKKLYYENGLDVVVKMSRSQGFFGFYRGIGYRFFGIVFGLMGLNWTEKTLKEKFNLHNL